MEEFPGLELKRNTAKKKNVFYLEIEGDENDADFKTEHTEFDSYEDLSRYLDLISKIGNVITSTSAGDRDDYTPTEEEEDLMSDICPYSDYGVHDLDVIEFSYYDGNGDKYDVTFGPEFKL